MGDAAFMARALALAQAQLGRVAPNPSVGCVIVRDGVIVGEGATGDGGRPHAEEHALAEAGAAAIGATAFVTLEPCAQRSSGQAACADRLIAAQVARVVVATGDPHLNASGNGLARMRSAGLHVETGLMAAEAERLNLGFFKRVRTGWPLVAVAADGQSFDAPFSRGAGETVKQALDRLGAAGLTRLWIADGDPNLEELLALGALTPPPPFHPPS